MSKQHLLPAERNSALGRHNPGKQIMRSYNDDSNLYDPVKNVSNFSVFYKEL